MSPNPKMAPIHAADPSGFHTSASMPILQSPRRGKKKPRRSTPPPPVAAKASTSSHSRGSLPSPAAKRSVSFSFPVMTESLSDSELLKQQPHDSEFHAGAKFSEAPSPENLPMPPTIWLGKCSVRSKTADAMQRGKVQPAPAVRKGRQPTQKPSILVPCQKMTNDLKLLLKVQ